MVLLWFVEDFQLRDLILHLIISQKMIKQASLIVFPK